MTISNFEVCSQSQQQQGFNAVFGSAREETTSLEEIIMLVISMLQGIEIEK